MYAIRRTGKDGSWLLPAFGLGLKVMTFDEIEEAKANLTVCESIAEEDGLELTFEIVDYE